MRLPARIPTVGRVPMIGPRVAKTVFAVLGATVVTYALAREYTSFSAMGAFLAVQPSVARSRQTVFEQLWGTALGAAIGVALGYTGFPAFILLSLGVGLTITVARLARLRASTLDLAAVVFLFVVSAPPPGLLIPAVARLAAITWGTLVGYAVNRLVRPPRYHRKVLGAIRAANDRLNDLCRRVISSIGAPSMLSRAEADQLRRKLDESLINADTVLTLYRENPTGTDRSSQFRRVLRAVRSFGEQALDVHKCLVRGAPLSEEVATVLQAAFSALMEAKEAAVLGTLAGDAAMPQLSTDARERLRSLLPLLLQDSNRLEEGLTLHAALLVLDSWERKVCSLVRQ